MLPASAIEQLGASAASAVVARSADMHAAAGLLDCLRLKSDMPVPATPAEPPDGLYQRLLLAESKVNARRRAGIYYTPPALVDLLTAAAARLSSATTIVDPACGCGAFLIGWLRTAGVSTRRPVAGDLHGTDTDPIAIDICRLLLWLQLGADPDDIATLRRSIRVADPLLEPPPPPGPHSPAIVLGNPPFINAINSNLPHDYRQRLRQRYPHIRGAADLSTFFLARALELAADGAVAMVLPRAILSARPAAPLRAGPLQPRMLWCPERCDLFPGAAIFAAAMVLAPGQAPCQVSSDPDLPPTRWTPRSCPADRGEAGHWAALLHDAPPDALNLPHSAASPVTGNPRQLADPTRQPDPPRLADQFQVAAGMTTAEAYLLRPHIRDDPAGPGLKLLITGLIDPGQSLWGTRRARYLGGSYLHPRVDPGAADFFPVRFARARRPKIIVAGLTRRLECLLDLDGVYFPAVATQVITHPTDDPAALRQLHHWLCSPTPTHHLHQTLRPSALRGQHITITKAFLRSLPLPG